VRGARIALLGVSYKPGVGDVRESPAMKIIELLRELGADVVYHDPYVPALKAFDLDSLELARRPRWRRPRADRHRTSGHRLRRARRHRGLRF
jgi:UDP-N-acetyl-D-mannosaminuronate dehydrogenase